MSNLTTAFVSDVGTKVEHIPTVGCLDALPGERLLDWFVMVIRLILLCMITLLGIGGMPIQGFASIFRHSDGDTGIHSMVRIHPKTVIRRCTAASAKIMVIADH